MKDRKEVIEAARAKYARLREVNPLVDELQRRFNLRVDVDVEAVAGDENPPPDDEQKGTKKNRWPTVHAAATG